MQANLFLLLNKLQEDSRKVCSTTWNIYFTTWNALFKLLARAFKLLFRVFPTRRKDLFLIVETIFLLSACQPFVRPAKVESSFLG